MNNWILIGKLKRAKNKLKIFKAIPLDKPFMPSELVKIVYEKSSNTYFNLVSRALKELLDMNLVQVLNSKERLGRLYKLSKNC